MYVCTTKNFGEKPSDHLIYIIFNHIPLYYIGKRLVPWQSLSYRWDVDITRCTLKPSCLWGERWIECVVWLILFKVENKTTVIGTVSFFRKPLMAGNILFGLFYRTGHYYRKRATFKWSILYKLVLVVPILVCSIICELLILNFIIFKKLSRVPRQISACFISELHHIQDKVHFSCGFGSWGMIAV